MPRIISTRMAAVLLLLTGAGLFAAGMSGSIRRDRSPRAVGLLIDPPAITQVIESSDPITVNFRLTNATHDVVQIGPVQTTCGCTVAEPIQSPRLRPGDTTALRLSVTGTDFGNRDVTVRVPYRQGEQHLMLDVPITLIGKTLDVPYVIQSPRELAVRQFAPGEGRREFEIQTCEPRSAPPWLTGFKADRSGFHARIIEQIVGEPQGMDNELRAYRCEVTGPLPEVGGESIYFTLDCAVASASAQTVPPIRCRWEHARRIQCSPQQLLVDSRQEVPEARVTFIWNDPDSEPDWENIVFDGLPSGTAIERSDSESSRHRAYTLRYHGTITEGFTLSVRSGTDGAALVTIPVSVATR